jgi:glucose dehydrogenase
MHPASRLIASPFGAWVMTALLTLTIGSDVSAQSVSEAHANAAPKDPPGEWRMQARDFSTTRYSTLNQINLDTVKRLRLA